MTTYFCCPPSVNKMFSSKRLHKKCRAYHDKMNNIKFHQKVKCVADVLISCSCLHARKRPLRWLAKQCEHCAGQAGSRHAARKGASADDTPSPLATQALHRRQHVSNRSNSRPHLFQQPRQCPALQPRCHRQHKTPFPTTQVRQGLQCLRLG